MVKKGTKVKILAGTKVTRVGEKGYDEFTSRKDFTIPLHQIKAGQVYYFIKEVLYRVPKHKVEIKGAIR